MSIMNEQNRLLKGSGSLECRSNHPEWFKDKMPKPATLPSIIWINKPVMEKCEPTSQQVIARSVSFL
jgi:hypothetical protein